MKKILITGANSYIGTSFEKYIKENYPDEYSIDTVDMIDGSWREKNFSEYDIVFHVAGIAHQKETKENAELYYKVNRDLAIETAEKSKMDGVKQFIFLSSMSVYGVESGVIARETTPEPKNLYGLSKLLAEQRIELLSNNGFKICIIRPPMVYGKDCKGNFQKLITLIKKLPVFPELKNQRSMIYIENLTRFVLLCIERQLSGVYLPQNKEYVDTTDMARKISFALDKKIYFSYLLGFVVKILIPKVPVLKKAFGSLVYENSDDFGFCYCEGDGLEKSV